MRSIHAHLRKAGMAAALAVASMGLFAPASFAAQQQHAYVAIASSSPCVSPPAGFNPLVASKQQLLYYGLPVRPVASGALYDRWVTQVTHARKRGCSEYVDSSVHFALHKHSSGLLGTSTGNGYSWSGFDANSNPFYAATGDWKVPCVDGSQSPSGSSISDWIGLGGYDGNQNLWQVGTLWSYSSRSWTMFYEAVMPGYGGSPSTGMSVNCDDNMSAQIDYGQTYFGQSYFFIEDLSTGSYWPNHKIFTPDTTTAEWIEEPQQCSSNGNWRMHADFIEANWTSANAGSGYSYMHTIAYYPNERFYSTTSITNNTITAEPDALYSDGQSFTDRFKHNGANSC